jgi:hypothetical protein
MGMLRVCCRSAAVLGVLCEKNEVGLQRDELCRQSLPRLLVVAPADVDAKVAAGRPARLLKGLFEYSDADLRVRIALGKRKQHADPPHPIDLLRPRRERPRHRAAENRDELSPPHGAHPRPGITPSIAGLGVSVAFIATKSGTSCPVGGH